MSRLPFELCYNVFGSHVQGKSKRGIGAEVLEELGISSWNVISYYDENVIVKSRQALEKYDDVKFFKENREIL